MLKKISVIVLTVFLLVACSSSSDESSNSSDSAYTYSEVTLNGKINMLSGSGLTHQSLQDYIVLIQNQISNRVYLAQVGSDGTFNFDSSGSIHQSIHTVNHSSGYGDLFMAMLVKKDPLEMVAVAYLPDSSTEGFSGLKISESLTSALTFDLDPNSSSMKLSSSNLLTMNGVTINQEFKIRLSDNKPVGADDFGKATAN